MRDLASSSLAEESVFWMLVTFFHRFELLGCFSVGLPRLQLCMMQWGELLQVHFPLIASRFAKMGLSSSMYASEWFLV